MSQLYVQVQNVEHKIIYPERISRIQAPAGTVVGMTAQTREQRGTQSPRSSEPCFHVKASTSIWAAGRSFATSL